MDTKWDMRFLFRAKIVSMSSKDPSTQAGAIIVRPNKSVASEGFNGFPIPMNDHEHLYNEREEKYSRIIHAEMNALNFSQDRDHEGYTVYTWPFLTCDRCFNHLMQAGIKRVVAPECPEHLKERWEDCFCKVRQYARETGIEVFEYRLPIVKEKFAEMILSDKFFQEVITEGMLK